MKKVVLILLMLGLVAAPFLVLVSAVKGNFKTIVAPDNYSTISVAIDNATKGGHNNCQNWNLAIALNHCNSNYCLSSTIRRYPFVVP